MSIAGRVGSLLRKRSRPPARTHPTVREPSKLGGVFTTGDFRKILSALPRDLVDLGPQLMARLVRPGARPRLSTRASEIVQTLRQDGVAVIGGVAPEALLERARRDFNRMVPAIETSPRQLRQKYKSTGGTVSYPVHEYQQELQIHRTHDPLMFSAAFAELALLPLIREVLAGYLGPGFLYQAFIATRTAPLESTRSGFAQWHHDARGRKLNVFVPLTAIPPDGQTTVYLRGSHRLFYSHARRRRNFFSEEEVSVLRQRYGLEEIACSAAAGSAIFFDSNGLHRGRRGPHLRDALQFNCMTLQKHSWPHEMARHLFEELSRRQQTELIKRTNLRIVELGPPD